MSPCDLCAGACCETLVVPVELGMLSQQDRRFFRLRGDFEAGGVRVDARCRALGADGRCTVYESRPEACRTYEVGSPACVAAVRARRPVHEARAILALMP